MTIRAEELRLNIIRPALQTIGNWSEDAEELLLLTCAHESHLGRWFRQQGGGPALGIYGMESATHDDIWQHFLSRKPDLSRRVELFLSPFYSKDGQLVWNLYYATAMARAHYLRFAEKLPDRKDVEAMGSYYKRYWATHLSKATVAQAVNNYKRLVKAGT